MKTPWRLIVVIPLSLILTSCASGSPKPVPSVSVAKKASESETFQIWLNALVNAYIENCIRLFHIRDQGEDANKCRELVE